jgi:hypothetical protein
MKQEAAELARTCTEAVRKGTSFPMVWYRLIKRHPLVEGIPRQRTIDGEQSHLDIPLITGERLVFDDKSKTFSLE